MAIKGQHREPSKKYQRIWDYMRRNRRGVKVADVLILIDDVTKMQLRSFFLSLEIAGYVKHNNQRKFTNREYRLIKYTGVKAPTVNHKTRILIDGNTHEKSIIAGKRPTTKHKTCVRIRDLFISGEDIVVRNIRTSESRNTVGKILSFLTEENILIKRGKCKSTIYHVVDSEKLLQLIEKQKEEQKQCVSKP